MKCDLKQQETGVGRLALGQACTASAKNQKCLTGRLRGGLVAAFSPRKPSRGFSLAESLIAFVVLIVAVLTLTSTYTYSQSRISLRSDELQAVTFGQQYLEGVRQQVRGGVTTAPSPATQAIDVGYSLFSGQGNYSSSSPAPEVTSPGNFTATSTLAPITGTSDYDVRVDVTWLYGTATQTVTLGTVVTTQVP